MKRVLILLIIFPIFIFGAKAKVIATVNGDKITDEDVKVFLQNPAIDIKKLSKDQRKNIIDTLIIKKLVSRKALKDGISKTKDFQMALQSIKEDLAFQVWQKHEIDKIVVSTKELKDEYKNNQEAFIVKAKVTARHILVKSEAEAKSILKEIKKSSNKLSTFTKLAKTKSIGPSKTQGGKLPPFAKGQMVPQFSDAAFAMSPKSYSKKPVKTKYGYHIIYVEKKTASSKRSFSSVRDKIKLAIKQRKFSKKVRPLANKLKAKANIVYK
jgi:parvulin-like peptidyl-prolyl isomerase